MNSVMESTISNDATCDKHKISNFQGHHHTKISRSKISESCKGKHKGPFNEEHKRRISESRKALHLDLSGKKNPFYHKHHTKIAKHKISAIQIGRKASEETLKRMSIAHKGHKVSKSTKAKLSKINRSIAVKTKRITSFNEHINAIEEEALALRLDGFKVCVTSKLVPDIIAKKDNKIYAIEIEFGKPRKNKYDGQNMFDDIIWIMKKHKK